MHAVTMLLLVLFLTKTDQKEINKFRNSFPHFRLKMEEVSSDHVQESIDETRDNFVSFLVDNVKELFIPPENSTMTAIHEYTIDDSAPGLNIFITSTDSVPNKIIPANNSFVTGNLHLPFLKMNNGIRYTKSNSSDESDEELLYFLKKRESKTFQIKNNDKFKLKRTCIACDNIINEDCSNPKSKVVPSIDCQRKDDLCYSQHTPFGIIDRGCFNVNHDLTIFVCACNLCNYISISEMPYIFSNKRDWVENVIELSRAKRFRESILKDMSCLRCEVNVSAKREDTIADVNCLEGNIPTLPSEVCTADEICGVKVIRTEGYIWRGCVTEPLYNYWWTFCDKDWCNYDTVVSIYDNIN